MWIYLLLIPLLFRPSWKLLGLLTLAVAALIGVVGFMTGTPMAATLFYGGVNLVVFAVGGAFLVVIRRLFNRAKQ
jgi:hypothetical protein